MEIASGQAHNHCGCCGGSFFVAYEEGFENVARAVPFCPSCILARCTGMKVFGLRWCYVTNEKSMPLAKPFKPLVTGLS